MHQDALSCGQEHQGQCGIGFVDGACIERIEGLSCAPEIPIALLRLRLGERVPTRIDVRQALPVGCVACLPVRMLDTPSIDDCVHRRSLDQGRCPCEIPPIQGRANFCARRRDHLVNHRLERWLVDQQGVNDAHAEALRVICLLCCLIQVVQCLLPRTSTEGGVGLGKQRGAPYLLLAPAFPCGTLERLPAVGIPEVIGDGSQTVRNGGWGGGVDR